MHKQPDIPVFVPTELDYFILEIFLQQVTGSITISSTGQSSAIDKSRAIR